MSLEHETCLNLRESEQPTIPPEFCKQERDGPNEGPLASFAAINNKSDQGNDANSSVIPPKNVYPRLACKEKEEIVKELNITLPISSMGSEGNSALLFRMSRWNEEEDEWLGRNRWETLKKQRQSAINSCSFAQFIFLLLGRTYTNVSSHVKIFEIWPLASALWMVPPSGRTYVRKGLRIVLGILGDAGLIIR